MKKLILLSLLGLVTACASAPQSSSDNSSMNSSADEEIAPAPVPAPVTSASAKPETAPIKPEQIAAKSVEKADKGISSETELDKAIKSQQDDKIKKAATEALLRNPQDVKAMNSLAMTYYRAGQFTAAAYMLNKALKVDDKSATVLNNLGVVYMAQGENHEAIQTFNKVIQVDPVNAYASANLGQIYLTNKNYAKAVIAYDIATAHGVRDWKSLNNYGVSLTATASYDKAQSVFKDLMKQQTGQREVLFNYAVLLIDHMEKYKDGLEIIKQLQFIGPPPDSRKKLAELEAKAKGSAK